MSSTQALPLRLAKHPALADLEPQAQPDVPLWVVVPPAADTGFRHAIGRGATMLARTDADCVPAPDWVVAAKSALVKFEMACGRSVPRLDEHPHFAERHFRRYEPADSRAMNVR